MAACARMILAGLGQHLPESNLRVILKTRASTGTHPINRSGDEGDFCEYCNVCHLPDQHIDRSNTPTTITDQQIREITVRVLRDLGKTTTN